MDRLARRLASWLRSLRPMPILTAAVAGLLVSVSALGALAFHDFSDPRPSGALTTQELHAASAALSAAGTLDTDLDGMEDAVENFLAGSDPLAWNTSGSRLPDGWLFEHGYDPRDPSIEAHPAATPPASALPAAYANHWPARFTPTLWEIYSHGRPENWSEASRGPFDSKIDPTMWDNSGDGIPDGWLLRYGLDPLDGNVSGRSLAGPGGLTVQEAFRHNTDPTRLDSDGDGLADREEMQGPRDPRRGTRFPPSDPSAYSTSGSGVCDGYLAAHGLDPSEPRNAYGDLARSGATTKQKFEWSHDRFHGEACSGGKGLDPNLQSTAKGPIPDGWLLRYGLDPLDAKVPARLTDSSTGAPAAVPPGQVPLPDVTLTVLDEYRHGRPVDWNEAVAGPWWGGTDPSLNDTDQDGLGDAVELRGVYLQVATDVGPSASANPIRALSDPTRLDSDGDGLTDLEEVGKHGTDPSRRDTDMDGIPDAVELEDKFGLRPDLADTAGDFLRDGARLEMLESRARQYAAGNFSYHQFVGQPGVERSVTDWACQTPGAEKALGALSEGGAACANALGSNGLAALFGPGGNLNARLGDDGKPVPNVLNPDIDGDGLLNGWEATPDKYRHSQFGDGILPRPASDPLNRDTDGDRLPDGWEVLHGQPRFDRSPGYYNLDPSRWDSDGDGGSDADEDPDGDGMAWVSYVNEDGVTVARPSSESFPNLLEWREDTDPNRIDSDLDELGDGWKVFWGNVYPTLDDDRLGLFHPPAGPGGLQVPEPRPRTGTNQGDVVILEKSYRRFVLSLGGREEMVERYGEQFVRTYEDIDVPDLDGGLSKRDVYEVTGTIRFGFKDAHEAGTNPYLEDTSGDGVPDWWALFYSRLPVSANPPQSQCVAGASLDPLAHYDADDDLSTNSGLTIRGAYENGTNPLCKDTDLDGLSDGYEVGTNGVLDPLDPSDAGQLLGDADRDGDGLQDAKEIVGVWHEHLGRSVRTDPALPDTDGDGLLDGGTVVPADAKWKQLYEDLGIAYTHVGSHVEFLGEADEDIRTSPLNPDDSGTGIPAGWLAAKTPSATQPGGDFQVQYTIRMPAWWTEALHGPWWGGLDADSGEDEVQNVLDDPDTDGDGLRDLDSNGDPFEDPLPFANTPNLREQIPWATYPESVNSLTGKSRQSIEERLSAQAYLNPKTVGTGSVHFSRPLSPPPMQSACLQDLQMLDSSGTPATTLVKGTPMQLKGKLVACGGNGFAGVTVEARLGSPPQTFGAGFTDGQGAFQFAFNVSSKQSIDAFPSVPVVLRGVRSDPAAPKPIEWSPDPSKVAPGNGDLLVQAYAAPAAGSRPALASATAELPVTVKAGAALRLTVPETTPTGPSFQVKYRLTDSSGTPLQDGVRFTWLGKTLPPSHPDGQGNGQVTLAAPHTASGPHTLVAVSTPDAGDAGFVDSARTETKVRLLNPIEIDITSAPDRIDAGKTIEVRGRVSRASSDQGVGNLTVSIRLLGSLQPVPGADVALNGSSFQGRIEVPAGLAGGAHHLVVQVPQGASTLAAQVSEGITVRSLPRFVDVRTTDILQGTSVEVSGRLLDPDAQPVDGAVITIRLNDLRLSATTDEAGRFRATLPGNLPVRPALQTLSFSGDDLHAPTTHRVERAVLANTTLTIQSGALARGAPLDVPIKLVTGGGDPVKGASIQVTWGDEAPVQVITDAAGQGVFHRDGHPTDSLGTATVRGRYAGSRDGGLAPSAAVAAWSVSTRAELQLPAGAFEAGHSIPPGTLRDAGTMKPLPNARVTLMTEPGNRSVVTTDAAGRFQVLDEVDRTSAPRHMKVTASFAGDAVYKAIANTTSLAIRTPTALEVAASSVIVMGRQTLATVQVHGLDGAAVDGGFVNITLDGVVVGSANVTDGVARVPVLVTGTARPGPGTLSVEYLGSDDYAPSVVDHPASIKQPVVLTLSSQPARPGQVTKVQILARSGDDPIPFSQVFLQVEGMPGGLVATTDEAGVATFSIGQPLDGARMSARFEGAVQLSPAQAAGALQPATQAVPAETAVQWLSVAMAVATVALSTLGAVVYRLRRSRLAPVLRQARRILGARGPHAQQILKAYRILQDAAIGYGFLEHEAPTPRGLEAAVARNVPAAARASLGRLMGLFEAARYGQDEVGPGHRAAALDALKAIERALQADAGLTWWRRPRQAAGVSA